MLVSVSTSPILRRSRRRNAHASQHSATSTTTAPADNVPTVSAQPVSLPNAEPCYNYFELFPEEVGAIGNVEVFDLAEARQWQLVGRLVPADQAEKEGGCVKVTMAGEAAPLYYSITDSDDEVYGRATYQPRPTTGVLKEEPSVFSECGSEACSAEDVNDSSSLCSTPCGSSSSMRCVYPVKCGSK